MSSTIQIDGTTHCSNSAATLTTSKFDSGTIRADIHMARQRDVEYIKGTHTVRVITLSPERVAITFSTYISHTFGRETNVDGAVTTLYMDRAQLGDLAAALNEYVVNDLKTPRSDG